MSWVSRSICGRCFSSGPVFWMLMMTGLCSNWPTNAATAEREDTWKTCITSNVSRNRNRRKNKPISHTTCASLPVRSSPFRLYIPPTRTTGKVFSVSARFQVLKWRIVTTITWCPIDLICRACLSICISAPPTRGENIREMKQMRRGFSIWTLLCFEYRVIAGFNCLDPCIVVLFLVEGWSRWSWVYQ